MTTNNSSTRLTKNEENRNKTVIEDDTATKIVVSISIAALTSLGVFVLKSGLLEILG